MALLQTGELPEQALAAAARFHAEVLPRVTLDEDLVLVFPPADHTHRAWRLAAIQGLARENAPRRVNAVSGNGEAAIAAAVRYLETAEGVTGHLLELDDTGAGQVVTSLS